MTSRGNKYGRKGAPERWKGERVNVKLTFNAVEPLDAELIKFMSNVPSIMTPQIIKTFVLLGFEQSVSEKVRKGGQKAALQAITALMLKNVNDEIEGDNENATSESDQGVAYQQEQQSVQHQAVQQPVQIERPQQVEQPPAQSSTGFSFIDNGPVEQKGPSGRKLSGL